MEMYGLAIVLLLAVFAYKFFKGKRRNYDVFLSFGDTDTCADFSDFLCNSLVAAGVKVYRDDTLPADKKIDSELAIRSCKIAIPIISEQYAESARGLRELTEIFHCNRKHRKLVFPVFYKVDIYEVLHQRGSFREALWKRGGKGSSREVRQWEEALSNVARIKGWPLQTVANGGRNEGKLVKMVVAKVSSELKRTWIEKHMFSILMSNDLIRSVYHKFFYEERRKNECEVFLAFRGPDTRYNLAAYLYTSLVAAGIRVFNDDDPSLIGEEFDREISFAITHCKMSIPILSEDYASSRWCLDELAQIVKRKRIKGQKILPIFYKVSALHVRDLSDIFGEKILKHKKLVSRVTYEQWKQALKEVGSFDGWESEKIANGHEGVLVKQVVEKVSSLLKNPQTDDTHPRPSDIDSILELETTHFQNL